MRTKAKPEPRPLAAVPIPNGTDAVLSVRQVAVLLDVTPRMVRLMLAGDRFPAPDFHLGRRPRWYVATFNAWLASRKGETV